MRNHFFQELDSDLHTELGQAVSGEEVETEIVGCSCYMENPLRAMLTLPQEKLMSSAMD